MPSLARLVAAVAVLGLVGTGSLACGLPMGGLGETDDGGAGDSSLGDDGASGSGEGGGDAGSGEAGVPPGCVGVDAACLGALPPGWQPVAVTDAGCAPGFDAETLLVNPRVGPGGCACGACQVLGGFQCDGLVAITSGDGCNDSPNLTDAAPGACVGPNASQHVEAHPPAPTGTVGCFVPNDAGTGATTDPLTVCVPGCSADYCGGASPRCVLSPGDVPCPTGFTLLAKAGTGADPGCPACACDAGPPGPCTGTVTVFADHACSDAGGAATYPVGTCNQFSTTADFNSLIVDLVPPAASCSPSSTTPGPADASLLGVHTICCQ